MARRSIGRRMRIDPWSSQQSTDYARLRDEFGISPFDLAGRMPDAPALFRRGVIFGHRGFEHVLRAIEQREPWAVLTGLMPSGPMHFGHKLVIDQVKYYQKLGADITLTVADIESYETRGIPLTRGRQIALDEYLDNYLALGLADERLQVYFQSERWQVKDLAWKLGRKVTMSTMESIYGFTGETNVGHVMAPLVQVGDILHVQLPEFGGPRPTVVPVGVDQDPHIRLTRDLAQAFRWYNVTLHDEAKLGRVVAVFVKGLEGNERTTATEAPEKLLRAAERVLKKLGYLDITVNEAYGALYVRGGADDVLRIDAELARAESRMGGYGFIAPAATYHRFMAGLTGGKMSSSKPETHISLRDDPKAAQKKLSGALTGGRTTAEEQRKLGAECGKCMVYETYVYHLVPEDDVLQHVWDEGTSGKLLCGDCKKSYALPRVAALMTQVADTRKDARARVEAVLARSREAADRAAGVRP